MNDYALECFTEPHRRSTIWSGFVTRADNEPTADIMALTFLTPQLPPCVCGVGDHTVQMATALRELVPEVTAVVLHPCPEHSVRTFTRIDVWDKSPAALSRLLSEHGTDLLWIQYSGYGFGYQGIPRFLIRAVEPLHPRPRIVVYFHEIHCAPHQLGWKGFVVSRLQKQIGKALADHAEVLFTSTEAYAQVIQHDYGIPSNRISLLPLGSNIPVPTFTVGKREHWRDELGLNRDDCVAVTFGTAGSQRSALLRNRDVLLAAVESGIVTGIICVGGDLATTRNEVLRGVDQRLAQVSMVMGYQPPERVAKVLVAADIGVMKYPFEHFGKSGVIMAFALAGLPLLVGNELPIGVDTFRAARLVRACDLNQLSSIVRDIDSRLAQQRQAAEAFGWPAIARYALESIRTMEPSTSILPVAI